MKHVLDNPAWNALNLGNKNLSHGTDAIKYFEREVSPFVAFEENTDENFKVLYDLIAHDRAVLFVTPTNTNIPQQWKVLQVIPGYQMVYDGITPLTKVTQQPVVLTEEHIPQMLELTQLTKPGPFDSRTIDFGYYRGFFDGDKLVAIAGQRMHPKPYAEVSAVCTHPHYLGRGYAKQLLLWHMHRITAAGETPFLHVRNDNERAIKVYESLGFKTRIAVYFYILVKQTDQPSSLTIHL